MNNRNQIMAVTVQGDSIDDVVSLSVSPGIALDPVKDHLGTIHAWVNSATGTIEQKMEYTAYGETSITQSSPALAALGMQRAFTGREYDMDTELQHNRARWYNAEAGRWMSKDPIGFHGLDENLYRYVGNDSIIRTDPYGKTAKGSGFLFLVIGVGWVIANQCEKMKPNPNQDAIDKCEEDKEKAAKSAGCGLFTSSLICDSIKNRNCSAGYTP